MKYLFSYSARKPYAVYIHFLSQYWKQTIILPVIPMLEPAEALGRLEWASIAGASAQGHVPMFRQFMCQMLSSGDISVTICICFIQALMYMRPK
jgi:hypothetical protein